MKASAEGGTFIDKAHTLSRFRNELSSTRHKAVAKGLTAGEVGRGTLLKEAQAEARRILRNSTRTIVSTDISDHLEIVVKRAAALTTTTVILPDHLPETVRSSASTRESEARPEGVPLAWIQDELARLQGSGDGRLYVHFVACVERPLLELLLLRTAGNQVKTAELLGINRNTLRKRIRELGIALPPRAGVGSLGSQRPAGATARLASPAAGAGSGTGLGGQGAE